MTNTCMCKRGFFVLRDCGNPAERPCQRCARPVCREHLSPHAGMLACVECVAREEQMTDDPSCDAGWAYRYRHRYYTQHDYDPIYIGTAAGDYYDDYDFRSFDREVTDDVAESDFGGAGAGGEFYES